MIRVILQALFLQNSLGFDSLFLAPKMFLPSWYREDIFYRGVLSPTSRKRGGDQRALLIPLFFLSAFSLR